jgi:hypothetical protein
MSAMNAAQCREVRARRPLETDAFQIALKLQSIVRVPGGAAGRNLVAD